MNESAPPFSVEEQDVKLEEDMVREEEEEEEEERVAEIAPPFSDEQFVNAALEIV